MWHLARTLGGPNLPKEKKQTVQEIYPLLFKFSPLWILETVRAP